MGGTGLGVTGGTPLPGSLEEIRSRLEGIAEDLADLARAQLRDALETGAADAVAAERRLSRARRAVLKAGALLGSPGGPAGTD